MSFQVSKGDIFCVTLDPVVGSEQGGTRPFLILQNNLGNRYSPTVIGAAITSKPKKAVLPTHIKVLCEALDKESMVMLEQIRTVDKARLKCRIGSVTPKNMAEIEKGIQISFGIKEN